MILHGDCRQQLATLPDASIDAIVTDPPYELGFMGKKWDASGIAYDPEVWSQCLRVLKPGGHLLAFGGTRTYHRMTCAIEDAGFEIRDSLHWLYGSGFPKSLDVSKAIDKARDDRADIYCVTEWIRNTRDVAGITNKAIDDAFGFVGMAGHWTSSKSQPAVPSLEQVPTLLAALRVELDDVPEDIRTLLWDLNGRKGQPGANWARREVIGTKMSGIANRHEAPRHTIGASVAVEVPITTAATDAAHTWSGWGTALKPAHEPIVLARKPLAGTVATNVMEYGTGALNIDGCRVGMANGETNPSIARYASTSQTGNAGWEHVNRGARFTEQTAEAMAQGRWPANIILTHAPECETECVAGCPVATLNEQSGTTTGVQRTGFPGGRTFGGGEMKAPTGQWFGDSGGASRFFTTTTWDPDLDVPFLYVAKPSRKERNAGLDGTNHHPTVKPVALIRHLIRLITPPGGTVLDPFLGSGTTAVAAILEGRQWIGCELTDDYLPIIEARTTWAEQNRPEPDLTLFTEQP